MSSRQADRGLGCCRWPAPLQAPRPQAVLQSALPTPDCRHPTQSLQHPGLGTDTDCACFSCKVKVGRCLEGMATCCWPCVDAAHCICAFSTHYGMSRSCDVRCPGASMRFARRALSISATRQVSLLFRPLLGIAPGKTMHCVVGSSDATVQPKLQSLPVGKDVSELVDLLFCES